MNIFNNFLPTNLHAGDTTDLSYWSRFHHLLKGSLRYTQFGCSFLIAFNVTGDIFRHLELLGITERCLVIHTHFYA